MMEVIERRSSHTRGLLLLPEQVADLTESSPTVHLVGSTVQTRMLTPSFYVVSFYFVSYSGERWCHILMGENAAES